MNGVLRPISCPADHTGWAFSIRCSNLATRPSVFPDRSAKFVKVRYKSVRFESSAEASLFHRIFCKCEQDDTFARAGADIGMQAQNSNTQNILNRLLEKFATVFD